MRQILWRDSSSRWKELEQNFEYQSCRQWIGEQLLLDVYTYKIELGLDIICVEKNIDHIVCNGKVTYVIFIFGMCSLLSKSSINWLVKVYHYSVQYCYLLCEYQRIIKKKTLTSSFSILFVQRLYLRFWIENE